MGSIPHDYDERVRFDAVCKAVLRNEARMRDLRRQRRHETSLDAVPREEMEKLSTVDHYPSDSHVFSLHGYDLLIDNELVANAFASLPATEYFDSVLRAGPDGRGDRRSPGNVQKCRIAAQDENPGGTSGKIDGADAEGRLKANETAHHKGRELLPLSVIHAAQAGDAEAMEQILRYYGGCINKLCT